MQDSWQPLNKELREAKIKVLKEEYMEADEIKKECFQFGSVVFKTKDAKEEFIKKERQWLPSLLTLATGINSVIFLVIYVFIYN